MTIEIIIAIGAFSVGVIVGALMDLSSTRNDDLLFDEMEDFSFIGRNK